MKKIAILTVLAFCLSNCEVKVKDVKANDDKTFHLAKSYYSNVHITVYEKDGIQYRVFHMKSGGIYVVNHTKELLEVEKLKRDLGR